MFLEKIPFINKLESDKKILYSACGLAAAGIVIIVISSFYGSGFAITNLLSSAALLGYIYLKDLNNKVKRFIPALAGVVSGIIGVVTFLNTFYLYHFSAGTSLLIQIIVLVSVFISIIILYEGINIYKGESGPDATKSKSENLQDE
ncbi:MAG: hypothetical protein SVR08_16350 [Spirochaetota bacterium]|nr:hypothetical protein [Spirochaetota bacterium]